MPNPYSPRTRRDDAPSFPEGRLERLGMTAAELADARAQWDAMTAAEQTQAAESIAALSDDELLADVAEQREAAVLDGLAAWASDAVDAGTFQTTDAALDALDAVAALDDDLVRRLLDMIGEMDDDAEVAQGGPGEAGEVPPDGTPEGGTDPSTQVLADARARIADGTPPSKVLRWVGTDKTRAAAVLVAEGERETPRVALVSGARAVLDA